MRKTVDAIDEGEECGHFGQYLSTDSEDEQAKLSLFDSPIEEDAEEEHE